MEAYNAFLGKYPKFREKTVLIQIAIPSRTLVPEYIQLKETIDKLVGQINGRFGTPSHTPIHYMAQTVPYEDLCALYQTADALLITSVRDGMNLVSLEYTACQKDRHGVLILSEFAGAAHSLGNALFVNPWDVHHVADIIHTALTMPKKEKRQRSQKNFAYVRDFTSAALAWRSLQSQVVISSFRALAIRRIKELDRRQSTALLLARAPRKLPMARVDRICADALHLPIRGFRKAWVVEAGKHGISIRIYTVNDLRDMKRLTRCGVDGIFTDRLDRLSKI